MKLFLASEAKHPESLIKLEKFVDRPLKELRIAYIPTAPNGEGYGRWKNGGSFAAAVATGADLEVVELEDMSYKDVISPLRKVDLIWMAGGIVGYLLYWIKRVELDKALPEILENTIYLGSSAGSMICSKNQFAIQNFIGEEECAASLLPGLGLIDFEIYPHYEEKNLAEIKKCWHYGELRLLKNGEVITCVDGKIETLGEERIINK